MLDCMEIHSPVPKEWRPQIAGAEGPIYLAIADALERDIREGRVRPGQRLPAQRRLADRLGVDFTTITRAYNEARAPRSGP